MTGIKEPIDSSFLIKSKSSLSFYLPQSKKKGRIMVSSEHILRSPVSLLKTNVGHLFGFGKSTQNNS